MKTLGTPALPQAKNRNYRFGGTIISLGVNQRDPDGPDLTETATGR
jgi:hypothetical protein